MHILINIFKEKLSANKMPNVKKQNNYRGYGDHPSPAVHMQTNKSEYPYFSVCKISGGSSLIKSFFNIIRNKIPTNETSNYD